MLAKHRVKLLKFEPLLIVAAVLLSPINVASLQAAKFYDDAVALFLCQCEILSETLAVLDRRVNTPTARFAGGIVQYTTIVRHITDILSH